jgi:hypothetical protein
MKKLAWAAAALLVCALIASPASAQRQDRNRIRAAEITQSNATTVYELVQMRRGMWLMRNQPSALGGSGGGLLVFLDGAQLEGVEDLRQVPTAGVQLVEFLSPAQAERQLGKYTTIGAIRVLHRDDTAPADSARAARPR